MRKSQVADPGPAASDEAAPRNYDEYIAGVPEPARSTLNTVRATILSAVPPETTEKISYGLPTFAYKGSLVCIGAFARHCSLFPMSSAVIVALKDELDGFKTSKGTIQFPVDKPLPAALVKKIVKIRIAENERKKRR